MIKKHVKTHWTAITTLRNIQYVYFKSCITGSLMWIAINYCLAQQQWEHEIK